MTFAVFIVAILDLRNATAIFVLTSRYHPSTRISQVGLLAALVTFVIADVAVTITGVVNKLTLSSTDLYNFHMCLCTDAHEGCTFQNLKSVLPTKRSESSQYNNNTEFSNVYLCNLIGADLVCKRDHRTSHTMKTVHPQDNMFSLYNETCDLKCVGFIWQRTSGNITVNEGKINQELCPSTAISGSQKELNTTVIVIALVSVIVVIIISSIIVKCVCVNRKKQLKASVLNTFNSRASSFTDKDQTGGLYAVSSPASSYQNIDKAREPLYFEVEKEKKGQEIRETIELESNNEKSDHVVNTYDVLPRNGSQI